MFDRIFFAFSLVSSWKSVVKILTAYLFYFPDDPSPEEKKYPPTLLTQAVLVCVCVFFKHINEYDDDGALLLLLL